MTNLNNMPPRKPLNVSVLLVDAHLEVGLYA